MKIAFITLMNSIPWGGSEELWYKTALFAKKQGHEVFVSVYKFNNIHPKIQSLIDNEINVDFRKRYNPHSGIISKFISFLKNRISYLQNNYKKLRKFDPEIIMINQGGSFDISVHNKDLREYLINFNIQYFLLCHSNTEYSNIPRSNIYPEAKPIFENAKHVLFVAEKLKYTVQRQLCTKLPNSFIIKNPININKIEYIKYPKNGVVNMAIVGILGNNKGHDILLEILSEKKWIDKKWILNIYGDGYGKKYLTDLAKYYKIDNKTFFHGHINDISQIWKKNHIFVMPTAGEGMPLSLIEAMVCGRPSILPDVGGIKEVITDNETGYIAEAPSVYSFNKALEKAWENRNNWEDIGKKAHEFAVNFIDRKPEKTLLNLLTE